MRKGRKGGDGKCPGLKGEATASDPALPGLSVLARLPRSSHTHRLPATAARSHLALPPTHRWWLLLWGVLQACPTGGSILLAQELPQQLTSPGYPEPYRKGHESSADIKAPEGFAVRLVFQDFDLEPSQDCAGDSVTVSWAWGGPARTVARETPGVVGSGGALNHPSGGGIFHVGTVGLGLPGSSGGPQDTTSQQRLQGCRLGPSEQRGQQAGPAFGRLMKGHTNLANLWSQGEARTHWLLKIYHHVFVECLLYQVRKLGTNNNKRLSHRSHLP